MPTTSPHHSFHRKIPSKGGLLSVLRVLLVLALIAVVATLMVENTRLTDALTAERDSISELQRRERENEVTRSVSVQLEEIARQQQQVSDNEREEAWRQKQSADRMRLAAEQEKTRYFESEQRAQRALTLAKEQRRAADEQRNIAEREREKAHEQSKITEEQRQIAELERQKAVKAQHEASRLRLAATCNNLATVAINLYNTNNTQLAQLMAYAAWHNISSIGGNTHTPEIFEALTLMGDGIVSTKIHSAAITDICIYPVSRHTSHVASCSQDGRIVCTELAREDQTILKSTTLFSDNAFRFTRIDHDEKMNIIAQSLDGREVVVSPSGKVKTRRQSQSAKLMMGTDITAENSQRTVFAEGTNTGEITLTNRNTGETRVLIGHTAPVTALTFVNNTLFSSSFDGTLKTWNSNRTIAFPVTLYEKQAAVITMKKGPDNKTLWLALSDGTLTGVHISIKQLAARLKAKLKRNLTPHEWEELFGTDIEYATFID